MKKTITGLFLFAPVLALAHAETTSDYGYMHMMPWGMGGFGSFWFWVGSLTMLVWLAVGVLVIAWLWKQINKK